MKDIYSKIRKLNDKGALLIKNKEPKAAKKYIDKAYEMLYDAKIEDIDLFSTVTINKIILEREFNNLYSAQKAVNNLISILEDNFPSVKLIHAKIISATIKSDLKQLNEAIKEFNECLSCIKFLKNYYNIEETMVLYEYEAAIYNNLAMLYSSIGNFYEALEYYKKSLIVYENYKNDAKYKFNKADTTNNIGVIYQKLNQHKKAIEYFKQAMQLHDNEYYLAMVYTNLSNSYKKLYEYETALEYLKKSIDIRKRIYLENNIYADNYADVLNNYGNFLNETMQFEKAVAIFAEALEIFNKLAKSSPEKYNDKIIKTLTNAAGSYCSLKDYEKARKFCKKALEFFTDNYSVNPIEHSAQISCILSFLSVIELEAGNITKSEEYCHEEFKYLSKIKTLLNTNNKAYLYSFKCRIEETLNYQMNNINNPDKLLMFIENKRNEDFIYSENLDINTALKNINKEVLITIESTTNDRIFIIMTDKKGNKTFKIENAEFFMNSCEELIRKICFDDEEKNYKNDDILKHGNNIFNIFPNEIKECFYNSDNKIFLSPGKDFMNFPFEFLACGKEFIGQKYLLPRVCGFNMFTEIINSVPKVKFQNKKIIILGNDDRLKGAKPEYTKLKNILKANIALSRIEATRKNIEKNLDNEIALFHFCGHGRPDKLSINYGKEAIDSTFFEKYYFKNHPLFFINCCLAGSMEYYGGGKFQGLAPILYKNGVKAVISSAYPIFDKSSKSFSINFYEKFLEGNSAGDSIMYARSREQTPWKWGLHFLYGNPYLQKAINIDS